MKFGIWTPLPHTIRPEAPMDEAVAALNSGSIAPGARDPSFLFAADIIRRADQLGFDVTLVAQRFLGPDLEAFTLASALAAVTERIELMVAVHPGMSTPQVVAKMAASLDRISGGRGALNIVNGWWEEEFDLFANGNWIGEPDERYPRMEEYIEVLTGLWTNPHFAFDGKYYRAHVEAALTGAKGKVVVPDVGTIIARPARSSIPLYAASRAAPGKEIVAQHCDVWFAEYQPGYRNFEANIARMNDDLRAMDDRAARHGRKLRYAINPQVIIRDTQEEAERLADEAEAPGSRDRISNALGAGLVGTPELVAERLRRYEEIGVDCVMLRFSPMMAGIEMFGTRVIPLLRG